MPVYPSGGTIAQSVGSPGFGPAPTPSYNASASVRLNPADTAYFSYVPTLQGSRTTWTWSGWVKRSVLGNTYQELFGTPNGASDSTFLALTFGSNGIADTLGFQIWNSTYRTTTQVFRDTAQWYHILLALDTTQSTAANRVKLYVNGTQITAFSTTNNPAQFAQLSVNVAGSVHAIGRDLQQSINFGGYLADINFVDGLALTPSSFTTTDANTGQLVPIQYTGSFGTNGFYLPFSGAALAADLGQNPKTTGQDFPYWPYNTLLVNTTSTNGAQNNTFLDSSTNNFTITRNGNTTQGNFTPFNYGGGTTQTNGYYSGYFDGTGDYLTTPSNAAFAFDTGDFAIEAWVYPYGTQNYNIIAATNSSGSYQAGRWWFEYSQTRGFAFITGSVSYVQACTVNLNVWTHIAVTRSGTSLRFFLNGVQQGSTQTASDNLNTTTTCAIGALTNGVQPFTGYISNARIVKGSAVYTANFTVPTTPLTAIANTSLLTCQSGQFIDNSTNAFAITANGNAQPLPTNPFNMTNWSGFFDGTGDLLSVPTNTNTNLHQIGDWTYEGWISWNSMPTTGYQNVFGQGVAGQNSFGLTVYNGTSWSAPYYFVVNQANIGNVIVGTTPLISNVWYHFAVVRSSGVVRLYVNGRTEGSPLSNSTNYAFGGSPFTIGNSSNGQISNFRFVRSAVYTANFTPPTAPLTAITNTQLLTCQNSTFIDNSPNNYTITVSGNSYTGTLNNPFGNPMNYNTPPVQAWSTYFDGNGDYISSPSGTPTYNLGMGLWTWEAWINTNSTATTQTVWQYYCTNIDVIAAVVNGSTGVVSFNVRATNRTDITTSSPSGSIKLNQWHHIAMVRDSGTNITCYIDGKAFGVIALAANASFSDTVMFTGNPTIGAKTNVVTNYFSGYISNLRFVRGSAVYTANFTPPTAPLTAIPGTMTLACQSNRVLDNSILNVAQAGNADTSISPLSPFIPTQAWSAASYGGTMYFDGTGDSLTIPGNSAFDFGTGNFTAEAWVYPMGTSSDMSMIDFWIGGGGSYVVGQWQLVLYTNNTLSFVWASGSNTAVRITSPSNTLPKNAWTHIAVTRTGNLFQIFTNGAFGASTTLTQIIGTTSSGRIGIQTVNNAAPFNGYISNARILKGTSLYTGPFVPPALPFTNISNTSLLLNATNAGIYDAAGDNVLETVGNAQVSTAVKKWGTSSVYFDGSGDALLVPATERMAFGTGDFTVEAWVYPTTTQGQYANIICNTNNPNGWFLSFSTGNLITFSNYTTVAITSSSGLSNNAWTHVAVSRVGTTIRMFFNGVQVASATNSTTYGVATNGNYIGFNGTLNYFLGYLQDVRVTKGVGRYQGAFTPPAAAFAYNQYDIGNQQWLPNNISVTAGINQDNLVDSPSDYGTDTGLGGQVRGNYATLNPLDFTTVGTISNGNLNFAQSPLFARSGRATIGVSTGKWYWEVTNLGGNNSPGIGNASMSLSNFVGGDANGWSYFVDGTKYNNNVSSAYGATYTTNDVIGIALDLDAGTITFYKNGVSQGVAFSGLSGTMFPAFSSSSVVSVSFAVNFGQRAFSYAAPAGFKCLVSTNLPTTNNIGATSSTRADDYFNVNTWTGNGSQVTVGFNPELLWYKATNAVDYTGVVDVLRGDTKYLQTWNTNNEGTQAGLLTKNSTGFVPGTAFSTNSYVSWSWKANGAGVANTAGTIPSTVSANTTSGCSIVTYTGNGTNGATVGHGLGVSPGMVIVKKRTGGSQTGWVVHHSSFANSASDYLSLQTTDGIATASNWFSKSSTTFGFPTVYDGTNTNTHTYVAYCFAPITGFSAISSYTGNGAADGPFVYTGFRPAFVMVKNTVTAATSNWIMKDELRAASYNPTTGNLYANLNNAQDVTATVEIDLLSNGFKVRGTYAGLNGSGNSIVYIAFAEFPFKYSRAR